MTNAATTRTVILVRHSKAEQVPGKPDHDRDLTGRGRRDAQAAGVWLRDLGLVSDVALCSPSERTRQTWAEIQFGGAGAGREEFAPAIYSGGTTQVLQLLRELPDDDETVIVIGHAPVMPDLASLLTSGEGSRQAHEALCAGYPTSGIAVIDYAGSWADMGVGTCQLRRFHVARAD